MPENEQPEEDFDIKKIFIPFTTIKAIHWIVIIGLVVFANMLFNGFVWDDKIYILNNADIRTLNLEYLFGPNTWNNGLYYRPLTALYFSFLYFAFNLNSFFYHLLQILLHITNSVLLFFVFKKFLNKHIAFFSSLIFLIHPIQVESVAFIAATLSPLSFLFGLLALLISCNKTITYKKGMLIFFFLLLSVLIKETGFLFLLFVILYRILFHFKKKEITLFLLLDIVVGSIYFFLRYFVGGVSLTSAKGTIVPIAGLNFLQRLENIPAIIFYYLKTFFYPAALAIDQQWIVTKLNFYNFFLPLLVETVIFLIIVFFGIYLFKTKNKLFKPFLFFFLWFGLALGFHLQLFPLDMTVADRFFYYPIAGILGMIGVGIAVFIPFYERKKRSNTILFIIVVCVIGILSLRTIVRNSNWHDEITLYTHDLNIYDSMNDEVNLGSDYAALPNYHESLIHYQRSAMILPTELNLYDVGYIYEELGELQKAKENYEIALAYSEYPADQHKLIVATISRRLAYVYLLLGQNKKAQEFIKKQLLFLPQQGYLWEYLAITEYRLHYKQVAFSAIAEARKYLSGSEINYINSQIINNRPIQLIPISSS